MATDGQVSWPSVGSSVAAYGQFFMAANTHCPGDATANVKAMLPELPFRPKHIQVLWVAVISDTSLTCCANRWTPLKGCLTNSWRLSEPNTHPASVRPSVRSLMAFTLGTGVSGGSPCDSGGKLNRIPRPTRTDRGVARGGLRGNQVFEVCFREHEVCEHLRFQRCHAQTASTASRSPDSVLGLTAICNYYSRVNGKARSNLHSKAVDNST